MATMKPSDLSRVKNITGGEKKVFEFLMNAAKPDDMFTCWCKPNVQSREPDFILFSKKQGLLVLEVKDWAGNQIEQADQHLFAVRKGVKTEHEDNPVLTTRS